MDDSLNGCEVVSDLMDGRLRGQPFSEAVQAVQSNAQARQAWHSYHVVAEVLRSAELAVCADDAGFLSRFQERMQRELPLRCPVTADLGALTPGALEQVVAPQPTGRGAANDAGFSWKWAAGFASLLMAAAAGWNVMGDLPGTQAAPRLAATHQQLPNAMLAEADQDGQVMIRDPRLDQLLMAHRQSGGTSVLQVPSGFLRNATFEVSRPQGQQK